MSSVAWTGAVVGSIIGSTTTAYIIGDERVRTSLTFAVPFLLLASIGVLVFLSKPQPPPATKLKLVPFNEIE